MGLVELLQLKGLADKMTVSSDPSEFIKIAESLGSKDPALVTSIATAVRATSRNPEETITEWFQGGGLARLLAGQKAKEEEEIVLQFPHCSKMLFLHG